MNKLKLNLADLRIEQFETEPGERNGEGTVIGQSVLTTETTVIRYCPRLETVSCGC